jgi:hypothetical protein
VLNENVKIPHLQLRMFNYGRPKVRAIFTFTTF